MRTSLNGARLILVDREQQPAREVTIKALPPSVDSQEPCRVWLHAAGQDKLVLRPGVTSVGRDNRCEIVFDDPLISRRHARFVVRGSSVTLEDLGSTNGVEVNGNRLSGSQNLAPGDRVVLGRYEAELCLVRLSPAEIQAQRPPPREPCSTLVDSRARSSPDKAQATRRLPTGLVALAQLADKALHLKHPAAAERILRRPLLIQLEKSKNGEVGDAAEVDLAAYFSPRLACLLGDPTWIDYVFKLLAIAKQLPTTRVIDELYQAVAQVPGADIAELRRYLEVLSHWQTSQLTPGDRFLIRRLEGLTGQL